MFYQLSFLSSAASLVKLYEACPVCSAGVVRGLLRNACNNTSDDIVAAYCPRCGWSGEEGVVKREADSQCR